MDSLLKGVRSSRLTRNFWGNHYIIFYVYDPNYICTKTYEEFLQSVPCCKYNDGYEKARKIRDEYLLTMENNNG